ncbi:MAG: thioesterase family protein [Bacteroidota bacterium]
MKDSTLMKDNQTYAGTYIIRVGDINYGGHMGNDRALLLFHDARIYFLEERGFSESDIGGPGIIMGDAHVYFKKEVFRGDELKIYVHIEDLRGLSFHMHYTVMRGEEEVINGSTKLIAFDYSLKKVVEIPEVFLSKLDI